MRSSYFHFVVATLLLAGGLLRADKAGLTNSFATATNASATQGTAPANVEGIAAKGNDLDLHQAFVKRAQQGEINIVFFGDSSTSCWQTTGKDIWDSEIAPLKAADFGIYGNNAQQLLWRLRNGELDGYQAKAVVVMIGAANLLGGDSPDRVVAAITAGLDEIKKRQPRAQILLFNPPHIDVPVLAPKNYAAHSLAVANSLAQLDDGHSLQVIDMTEAMKARETEILFQMVVSGDTHKSHAEFEVWWNALKAPLAKIFSTIR